MIKFILAVKEMEREIPVPTLVKNTVMIVDMISPERENCCIKYFVAIIVFAFLSQSKQETQCLCVRSEAGQIYMCLKVGEK